MTIKIIGNKSYGNRLDGIRLAVGDGIDAIVENNDLYDNGRHGLNVIDNMNLLHEAGVKVETPIDELEKAYEELLKSTSSSDEENIIVLEKIDFSKWVQHGASLATIASLIIQIFSK